MKKPKINKLSDLMELLPKNKTTEEIWFRGHSDHRWKLLSRLARIDKVNKESELIKRFKLNAYPFLDRVPSEEWEWLFMMQHFGVPTRLLDWTESPLIALYFCLFNVDGEEVNNELDGALWILKPKLLNLRFNNDIPSFEKNGDLEDFTPERIRAGKDPNGLEPVAIIAPRQFERIYAQQGVFTISYIKPIPVEECSVKNKSHVTKIIIPAAAKDNLRKELKLLRITHLTVFPQLENVAKNAMEVLR